MKPQAEITSASSMLTSTRERRLWVWAAVVVTGIYSTLGLARTMAGVLREADLSAQRSALVRSSFSWLSRREGCRSGRAGRNSLFWSVL